MYMLLRLQHFSIICHMPKAYNKANSLAEVRALQVLLVINKYK